MSFYIYRRASSDSARALTNALQGVRCVGENSAPRKLSRFNAANGDVVVFWGDYLPGFTARALNAVAPGSKITDAIKLTEAGVPTITIASTRPIVTPGVVADDGFLSRAEELKDLAFDFAEITPVRGAGPYLEGVKDLAQRLATFRDLVAVVPAPAPVEEWLPRLKNHVGGNDLLGAPIQNPDYWVKKEKIAKEFRVHSFGGKSIRAGMKVPREGFTDTSTTPLNIGTQPVHSWVRSWEGGWRISYDGDSVRQKHRDVAHAAVKALGLDFGAVDVAERPDGSVFVLEVNRAPGIEAGTIDAYARVITNWAAAGALSAAA